MVFFFFKQKTAYEMRISDWSSDVCSSDLTISFGAGVAAVTFCTGGGASCARPVPAAARQSAVAKATDRYFSFTDGFSNQGVSARAVLSTKAAYMARSEEHTSELQSLMRISYAVLCLKKKTKKSTTT